MGNNIKYETGISLGELVEKYSFSFAFFIDSVSAHSLIFYYGGTRDIDVLEEKLGKTHEKQKINTFNSVFSMF